MVNMPHMLKYVGPRGLYLNIKGLLFLRNQGSHLPPVLYGDRYWLSTHSFNGPSIHNTNMWPAYACLFQHQRYTGGLVQA